MSGTAYGPRFCGSCGRLNEGPRTTCFGCGAPLAPAALFPPYGGPGPPPGPTPPSFYQPGAPPPWIPGQSVPPGFSPPPLRPPEEGLSTVAIVVIVVVVVVAATLIPAAILYVLVSGVTRSGASSTYELGLSVVSDNFSTGPPATGYVTLALGAPLGLVTSLFGLRISNASTGVERPTVEPSPGCVYGVRPSLAYCPSNGVGWYAVLEGQDGAVLATYGASAWSHFAPGVSVVPLTNFDHLLVVSDSNYTSAGLTIQAFGTGAVSVVGTATL